MPLKCKCDENIVICPLHNMCQCGKVKKIVSNRCKDCYYTEISRHNSCRICGKKRKKKTANPLCRTC